MENILIQDDGGQWLLCDRFGASCDLATKEEKRAIQGAHFLCGKNFKIVRHETASGFPWESCKTGWEE